MKIAITGRPGIGKTTACIKIFNILKDKIPVKGFVTTEIREKGIRIGFIMKELHTDFSKILSRKEPGFPRVGSYRVYLDSLEEMSRRIKDYRDSDLIIIDEVGPMELKSRKFVEAVDGLIDSDSRLIFTVHYRSSHPLAERIRREFKLITLTEGNRDRIAEDVVMEFDL